MGSFIYTDKMAGNFKSFSSMINACFCPLSCDQLYLSHGQLHSTSTCMGVCAVVNPKGEGDLVFDASCLAKHARV